MSVKMEAKKKLIAEIDLLACTFDIKSHEIFIQQIDVCADSELCDFSICSRGRQIAGISSPKSGAKSHSRWERTQSQLSSAGSLARPRLGRETIASEGRGMIRSC